MRTRASIVVIAALSLAGCGTEPADEVTTEPSQSSPTAEATTKPTSEPAPETTTATTTYPDFADVDPYTHGFFITLEDTNLAEGHGEQALWNYGTRTCERLDAGEIVQERVDEFAEYDIDVVVIAAAVNHICDQHRDAVQQWVDENS